MRAGKLRHFVTIQSKATTFDSSGDPTATWSTHARVWADIKPVRGREFFEARAINTELTVRFVTRFVSGVTQEMRIKDKDDNLYDIIAPIHIDYRRRELNIMTTQVNKESA